MNADGRRCVAFGYVRLVDRCADHARFDATLPLRPLARNAQAANVLICIACSAERHKREVQVKGKTDFTSCTFPGADHGH